jgi:DNA end-binding protein Ku
MARSLWTGSLSFGLVNVPVALFSALRDRDVHFNELHEPDHSPIEAHRVCAEENREVPWEEIVKGYELEDGRWVLLTDDDLQAAAPRQSRTIDIERFVQEQEIDPLYLDRPYLLTPSNEGAARAYALLSEVMGDSEKVALGRFVLRARQRLVSIRSREGALTLTTMRFHDEVRRTNEIAEEIQAEKPTRKQIEHAVAVIEEQSVPFAAGRYRDEHRAHLRRIIKSKQKGEQISIPVEPEEPATVAPDLMGALEQSLAQIKGGKTNKRKAKKSPRDGVDGSAKQGKRRSRS